MSKCEVKSKGGRLGRDDIFELSVFVPNRLECQATMRVGEEERKRLLVCVVRGTLQGDFTCPRVSVHKQLCLQL